MSEWIQVLEIFLAGAGGYVVREIIARIQAPPKDLSTVLEAFGAIAAEQPGPAFVSGSAGASGLSRRSPSATC